MDDILLDRLAEYYCSEYVAKNQPWIRQIPFHEWLERELLRRAEHAKGELPQLLSM